MFSVTAQTSLILLLFFVMVEINLPTVMAKCCLADFGGDCSDNSKSTPCCGYRPCNGFCCACPGVSIIREEVEAGGHFWTTTITAPYDAVSGYATWTCRASHITTWYPPPTKTSTKTKTKRNAVGTARAFVALGVVQREVEAGVDEGTAPIITTVIVPPKPTFTYAAHPKPPFYDLHALAALHQTFNMVSGGTAGITLQQYLGFFNATSAMPAAAIVGASGNADAYSQNVVNKFRMHDRDGDELLSIDEVMLLCDENGCQ